MIAETKLEVGDLVKRIATGEAWHVERLAGDEITLRRGRDLRTQICKEAFAERFHMLPKEPVIQAAGEVSELDKLEQAALRNLRDVVRGELRERDKKTGFFDEAKAWVNLRNALSVC
jgi:hypothetical protein